MNTLLIALVALGMVVGGIAFVVPEASACIQVYPWSRLCGNPVGGTKWLVCEETGRALCLP